MGRSEKGIHVSVARMLRVRMRHLKDGSVKRVGSKNVFTMNGLCAASKEKTMRTARKVAVISVGLGCLVVDTALVETRRHAYYRWHKACMPTKKSSAWHTTSLELASKVPGLLPLTMRAARAIALYLASLQVGDTFEADVVVENAGLAPKQRDVYDILNVAWALGLLHKEQYCYTLLPKGKRLMSSVVELPPPPPPKRHVTRSRAKLGEVRACRKRAAETDYLSGGYSKKRTRALFHSFVDYGESVEWTL